MWPGIWIASVFAGITAFFVWLIGLPFYAVLWLFKTFFGLIYTGLAKVLALLWQPVAALIASLKTGLLLVLGFLWQPFAMLISSCISWLISAAGIANGLATLAVTFVGSISWSP